MIPKSCHLRLISLVIFIGLLSIGKSAQSQCDSQNPPLQCLLFKQYPNLNDQLACQLCAVAIDSGKYPQKAWQFCTNGQTTRNCGLISFTYLLTAQKFVQAFNQQYEVFYRDPFNHDQRVTSILKKQNIRSILIGWSQNIPQNPPKNVYLSKAVVDLYLDDIKQSQKNLQQYISLNAGVMDKTTIKLMCRIYQKQGQFNQALNVLSKYVKQQQQDQRNYDKLQPYLYHLKGNLLMHHLKFDQAIIQFNKASNMFKSYYQQKTFMRGFIFSNYNIGLCYQKLSKHQEAIKKYTELVKFGVKNAEVLNALGNSYIQQAQKSNSQKLDQQYLRKGIFYFQRAIDDNPQYYLAHYNLGYAYLRSNQLQKAIEKFKDSIKIKKTSQAQYALLTAYFLSNKQQQAENLIKNQMTVNDQSIDDILSVYYQYGNEIQNPKFYTKVLNQFEDLIKSANGHYWKAMIQFQLQNYGLAIDHFLKAYDKGYSQAHLLFNLAYAYQLVEDYTNALSYYEKAYKKDPRPQTKQKIQQSKSLLKQKQKQQEL